MNTLCLVNPFYGLEADFVPKALVQEEVSGIWICKKVLKAFNRLNKRLIKAGIEPLVLVSGYRPYSYQEMLFDRKTKYYMAEGLTEECARVEAAKIVARPGHSEHQLGLAIDVTTQSMSHLEDPLITDFSLSESAKWLFENSHKEGFILRYPMDKQHQTHITYEPWHYRYVGVFAATRMKKQKLCLEEYLKTKCKG